MARIEQKGDLRVDQIMPELCPSWVMMPFEECLHYATGRFKKLKKKDIKTTGRIPVIDQGETFVSGYIDNETDAYEGSLPVIIFGDHTRRIKFIDFPFAVGADGTKILKPIEYFNPKFFYYYLRSLNLESQGYSRHYRFLKQTKVPIPSHAEQRRIVAKLEKILAKVNACKERLEKIPAILKRFRQSVLTAACSGRFTVDLRKKNLSHALKEAEQIEEEFELPPEWSLSSLRSLVQSLEQGWSPKCEIESSHSQEVWGVIKTTAVQALNFIEGENKRLPAHLKPREDLELRQGDLLITRAGPRVRAGVCCMVYKVRPRLIICDKVYRFRANESKISGEFMAIALNSPSVVEVIDNLKTGISDSGVNLTQDKFLNIKVPLPGLVEQHEIVRRVEALFKIADDIEKRYEKAKAHVDKLTQSILAKAFRGELDPQDPNDEPASELLKRIQAERKNQDAEARPGRKSAKRRMRN